MIFLWRGCVIFFVESLPDLFWERLHDFFLVDRLRNFFLERLRDFVWGEVA